MIESLANLGFPSELKVNGFKRTVKINEFFKDSSLCCVFLKQFPSIRNQSISCFQKITHAQFRLNTLHKGGIYTNSLRDIISKGLIKHYDITISPVASHPIVKQFGLKADLQENGNHKMQASGGWLDIDYVLELGE